MVLGMADNETTCSHLATFRQGDNYICPHCNAEWPVTPKPPAPPTLLELSESASKLANTVIQLERADNGSLNMAVDAARDSLQAVLKAISERVSPEVVD
jgi:hypothetical protein